MKHPAKFTDSLMPVFEKMIPPGSRVLDPFAGTGKIHLLPFNTTGLEIEPEWSEMHPDTVCGDATSMPFKDCQFDVICTSPTYGNRMADCHNAKDGSRRNTYTHTIGRPLNGNNSGKMQWGKAYRQLHEDAYRECFRVLRPGGLFILNMKNHVRGGKVVPVYEWHIQELQRQGFVFCHEEKVKTPSNRYGKNGSLRIPYEYVTKLFKEGEA